MNLKRKSNDIYFGLKNKIHKKDKIHKSKDNESNSDDENLNIKNDLLDVLGKKDTDSKIERESNHIYFYSEINRESIFSLLAHIREAEEDSLYLQYKLNLDEVPIYLHINSYGGSVHAAFAAIDAIQSCRIPIYTIIEGATASAGTLISVVGKKRFIRPNAMMLIHELSAGCWGKMSEIEDEYKNLQDLMVKIKKIYKENTNLSKKELNEILKHDLWFDSDLCLKNGMVDELWTK